MKLSKVGKLQMIADDDKVSPDNVPYRATKWRHESGTEFPVNVDEYGYHAKIGNHTAVNQDEEGLINFILRVLGRR
jgi:hypothetical protein